MTRLFSPALAAIAAAGIAAGAFALRAADDKAKEGASCSAKSSCTVKTAKACSDKAAECADITASAPGDAKAACGDKAAGSCSEKKSGCTEMTAGAPGDDTACTDKKSECADKAAACTTAAACADVKTTCSDDKTACSDAKTACSDAKAAGCGAAVLAVNATTADPDCNDGKECCGGDGCAEGGDKACCKEKADKECCAAKLSAVHPSFAAIKALAGEWRSPDTDNDGNPNVVVTYRVTSGGSAVLETLFPGAPHEMITVYTADSDYIWVTHFCAIGNQPRLKAKPVDGNVFTFNFVDAGNLKSTAMPHMNSLIMTINGEDNMTAEWGSTKGGEAQEPHKFVLKRVRVQG